MLNLEAIGSDPEAFLFIGKDPISAIGLVPGSKKEPFRISDDESVQVDNVAIEFNVKPTLDPAEFMASLGKCVAWMDQHVQSINPLIRVSFTPSVEFSADQLESKAARVFGCDVDYNAWTGLPNARPNPKKNPTLRSCGGHIHLGYAIKLNPDDELRLIRLLDQHVGIYTAYICKDERRMKLYGKAGAFRPKPYGIEYRTPSNTWLSDEGYITEVFKRVKFAVEKFNDGEDAPEEIRSIINDAAIEEMKVLLEKELVYV